MKNYYINSNEWKLIKNKGLENIKKLFKEEDVYMTPICKHCKFYLPYKEDNPLCLYEPIIGFTGAKFYYTCKSKNKDFKCKNFKLKRFHKKRYLKDLQYIKIGVE